ncbi:MAG: CcmD family protein [Chloroflexota bacterium]
MTTLAIILIVLWTAITIYLLSLGMTQRRVEKRLQSLVDSIQPTNDQ